MPAQTQTQTQTQTQANTHETIAECLAQAESSDSLGAQCAALQTLSSLTKVSTDNRTLLAHTPGALTTILSLSKSTSHPSSVRTLSLSILFHLSLNPDLKRPLATPDTITHLNSLILSPCSPHSGKLAASLICSLAMLHKNKAVFGVAGTVESIIQVLDTTDSNLPAARHLLSSLAELVQFHGNCTLAVRANAVPLLVRILEGPADDLSGSALTILSLLARFEEGINAIRGVEGVVGVLVDGLRRACTVSRESAADILVRLFEESQEFMREAAGNHEFPTLLADLSIRGSAGAREKAGLLMKMMMEANLDCYVEGSPIILR